jgi:hypothetical protein
MASKLHIEVKSLPHIKVPKSMILFSDMLLKSAIYLVKTHHITPKMQDEQRKLDFVTLKTNIEDNSEKDINMASISDYVEDLDDAEKVG